MIKIKKSQQKIIVAVAVVLIVTLGFTQLVYLPKRRAMNKLMSQINALKEKISKAQIAFGQPEELSQTIITQKKQLTQMLVKFPKKQDLPNVIKELSTAASGFAITIVSIKPQDSNPYLDAAGQAVLIDELVCERLPLAIELESRFSDFGRYLEFLSDGLSAQISIDDLKITRDENIQPSLRISLLVSVYVLSSPGK